VPRLLRPTVRTSVLSASFRGMMANVTSTKQIRELALGLPEVTTGAHFDREAFKIGGKIFATLGEDTMNLRLMPEQQSELLAVLAVAEPCAGAWGRQGWTQVRYSDTSAEDLEDWLGEAWRYRATAKIRAAHAD
jgi:hypothetical protein